VEIPHPRREDLITTIPLHIRETLRTRTVAHLGALVPLHSEVLSSRVRLPTTEIIPGMIDLTRDDHSVEEDVEEADFRTEVRLNE
jgi:hypothetical protein